MDFIETPQGKARAQALAVAAEQARAAQDIAAAIEHHTAAMLEVATALHRMVDVVAFNHEKDDKARADQAQNMVAFMQALQTQLSSMAQPLLGIPVQGVPAQAKPAKPSPKKRSSRAKSSHLRAVPRDEVKDAQAKKEDKPDA